MPRIEMTLRPDSDWNAEGIEDWSYALAAFLTEKGKGIKHHLRLLPGYQIIKLSTDEEEWEVLLSESERVVMLDGFSVYGSVEREFAYFTVKFARQIGAIHFCASLVRDEDEVFWRSLGANFRPDPVPLKGAIKRNLVGVEQLHKLSLLVTYKNEPVLCLEPIFCNTHAPGPISLAQRRVEKLLGGQPLGFASRVAMQCPWEVGKTQWDHLLAFSRLQVFDVFSDIVFKQYFSIDLREVPHL
ncbi:MAG: hypothetical protein M0T74_12895 [Desulfitobacterium hafniense]|nr:hypothetical protein [Desulfitobacterium hafniense]